MNQLLKSCSGSIKMCPQLEDLVGSRSYQESIERLESFSMDQATIEKLSRMR